jgi:gamma-glutamyl hercynylcysteine S-oxide hydrolase
VCRHLAYLGPSRPLDELVLTPPHSLLRQSYAPRDMRGGGTMNADGYGLGWYVDGDTEPVRHRRTCPMWADDGLASLTHHIRAPAALAAVRSATVGMPVVETAVAPFAADRWLFSHNGVLPGWPDSVEPLAGALATHDLMTLEAPTDSALLWALVRSALRTEEDPVKVLTRVTHEVVALEPSARLNLLLTDGQLVVATAWYHALSVLPGDDFVVLASEPWDGDPRWRPVPDRHLVTARLSTDGPQVSLCPLEAQGAAG